MTAAGKNSYISTDITIFDVLLKAALEMSCNMWLLSISKNKH